MGARRGRVLGVESTPADASSGVTVTVMHDVGDCGNCIGVPPAAVRLNPARI